MAIPFNLPSDEETNNNYRSMDDLLLQLYQVLRQILLHRHPTAAEINLAQRNNPRATPRQAEEPVVTTAAAAPTTAVVPDTELPRLPQPDIVQCSIATPTSTAPTTPRRPIRRRPSTAAASTPQPPPRRGRRRRVAKEDEKEVETTEYIARWMEPVRKVDTAMRDNWTQVGEDLRKIADEFSTASLQDNHLHDHTTPTNTAASASNQKGVSLLSLLVPPPFSGSVWMAMIFLLGWGVIQRSR